MPVTSFLFVFWVLFWLNSVCLVPFELSLWYVSMWLQVISMYLVLDLTLSSVLLTAELVF